MATVLLMVETVDIVDNEVNSNGKTLNNKDNKKQSLSIYGSSLDNSFLSSDQNTHQFSKTLPNDCTISDLICKYSIT